MKLPKKPSLPSQDESRRTNVLFEKLMSEFRTVGESVSAIRERVDRIEPKLDKQGEDIEILKAAARSHTDAIRANTEATHSIQDDVVTLKSDVAEIKGDIKGYNQRLEVVESKLAS